jgi:hypothetical protein
MTDVRERLSMRGVFSSAQTLADVELHKSPPSATIQAEAMTK